MPKEFSRTERIADLMQRELAILLQREAKDPRFGIVTVSGVKISKDLAYAKVYVTVFSEEEKIKDILKTLNKAAGYFRTLLAHRVKLRTTPELHFVYDDSIVYGNRLSSLIDSAVTSDKKKKE